MLSGGALGLILLLLAPSRWALGMLLGAFFRAIVALGGGLVAQFGCKFAYILTSCWHARGAALEFLMPFRCAVGVVSGLSRPQALPPEDLSPCFAGCAKEQQ